MGSDTSLSGEWSRLSGGETIVLRATAVGIVCYPNQSGSLFKLPTIKTARRNAMKLQWDEHWGSNSTLMHWRWLEKSWIARCFWHFFGNIPQKKTLRKVKKIGKTLFKGPYVSIALRVFYLFVLPYITVYYILVGGFEHFLVSKNIRKNNPNWLNWPIFFRWVETTTQIPSGNLT